MSDYLGWVDFYMELADKLLPYRNDRKTLIEIILNTYSKANLHPPTLDANGEVTDIDPFTVFGLFNKGITAANRIAMLRGFAREFGVEAPVPRSFDGIPVLNNLSASFYHFAGERQADDIDNLWSMFAAALDYADSHSADSRAAFVNAFDTVSRQKGVKWNLTMGLYWVRPYEYINLDSRNRWFISILDNVPSVFVDNIGSLDAVPSGEEYLTLIDSLLKLFASDDSTFENFAELSYCAWSVSEEIKEALREEELDPGDIARDDDGNPIHYWIYSAGSGSKMWNKFYQDGVMAIAREYLGDLRQYSSKSEMRARILAYGGDKGTTTCKNVALEAWQFLHDVKVGDVIFVKKGNFTIIGRGIVTSDYYYDENYSDEYRNLRKVRWINNGEWEHPGQAVSKPLTDITPYTQYVKNLNAIFEDEFGDELEDIAAAQPTYTADDFLREVYMSREKYDTLKNLLVRKKNVILQGAPGVGKTFVAKRLAYSMMGVKDPERVMMVQFHQSYSYEDFIMGFRPAGAGFELRNGAFYSFCKKAEEDAGNDYFFIIDEINRGNLSKIFGELFMLIEGDKRGTPLRLLYSDEMFAVPKNVYIIGMMNTADRSLAMLDYALRRRFAFFDLPPAFDSEGFCRYREGKSSKKFDSLIMTVEKLNNAIENDDALGRGFRIGHSYFCTQQEIDDVWLNSVVTYELIPLLSEYWFDEPSKIRDWEHALREAIR